MGSKQRNTITVIGEGITEKHWLLSLKDAYPYFRKVDYVELEHANNMAELEKEIEKAAKMGYAKIFCMIDMDNKKEGVEHEKYMAFKRKYAKPIVNKRKGIDCEVRFYETDRCTEQFFLYYFSNTTKAFQSYEDLEKELHKYCEYEKRALFFVRHPLHNYFQSKGGNLDDAIKNANASAAARDNGERDYSYSELGKMMEDIKEILS